MQRFIAVVGILTVSVVLLFAAQAPRVLSALLAINLAPGDALTITCGTTLSGTPTGQQAKFSCAPVATPTPTSTLHAPTATRTPMAAATPTATRPSTRTSTPTPPPTPLPFACPCSIFSNAAAPIALQGTVTGSVELGVKFRVDTSGFIAGVRFYKLNGNTSRHVAHLSTDSGTLLASATFSGESAAGWQQVNFAGPVPISANTTYVGSYHTEGRHAADPNFFRTRMDNAPVHALADGDDGGNGVFSLGPGATFPTSTVNASNYWVDVVFQP